jgi:hypothetical protein
MLHSTEPEFMQKGQSNKDGIGAIFFFGGGFFRLFFLAMINFLEAGLLKNK